MINSKGLVRSAAHPPDNPAINAFSLNDKSSFKIKIKIKRDTGRLYRFIFIIEEFINDISSQKI